MLPTIPITRGPAKWTQNAFGGLDRRPGAGEGAIAAMTNMTGDDAPLLASREKRNSLPVTFAGTPHGLFANGDDLYYVDGNTLYINGTVTKNLRALDCDRVFAALGERVIIWPDKILIYFDHDASEYKLRYLERSDTKTGLYFKDGTYAGEPALANTIYKSGMNWGTVYKVGDAVTISGCVEEPANNKTAVIREIDGNNLRFYENTFTIPEGQTEVKEEGEVTVARVVPDLDYLCSNENRLWGCIGDTVWCSKLGDPYNWNVFDGLSTDAWSVESGTAGVFTGCVSYLGYPMFFKEDRLFKVYGSRPGNFELMGSATLGVTPGAYRSLAVAGETLFYLSRAGFVACSGGMPRPVGGVFGDMRFTGASAGSDGLKYYVSAVSEGDTHLLVYDTRTGLWHREDGLDAPFMAWRSGALYAETSAGAIITLTGEAPAGATEESAPLSSVTFALLDFDSFDSKYPTKLWIRAEAAAGVTLTVSVSYDGGAFEQAAQYEPGARKSRYFSVPIRRCDSFSLKLAADGAWRLYALEYELYVGTESRR